MKLTGYRIYTMTSKSQVLAVLNRQTPDSVVFSPNLWQWFAHNRNHGLLPAELSHCRSQLDVIRHLGTHVCSRNTYCDERRGWFGGLADPVYGEVQAETREHTEGKDLVIEKSYLTKKGALTERLRYVHAESTLVQEKFVIDDYASQLDAMEELVRDRRWRFVPGRFNQAQADVDDRGCVVAGELYSPLKLLHLMMGPENTTYLLMDYPERAAELLRHHEEAQLDLVGQMADAGVKVMMSMDNLDTAFHPPAYVELYSASFYEKAACRCHASDSRFFIHACGHQKDNLALIAGLGVDGLEGVSYPPFGDVELDEAMRLSGDRLIVNGGISPIEYDRLKTRAEVLAYVRQLFERLRPYAHRLVFSASCNTPYTASWDMIRHFRDAWKEYGAL